MVSVLGRNNSFNFLFYYVAVNNFSVKKVLIGHYRGFWNSLNKPFGGFFLADTCIFSFDYMYFCYRRALFFIFKIFIGGYNRFVFFVNGLPFISYNFLSSKFIISGFFNKFTKSRTVVRWVPGMLTNFKVILTRLRLGRYVGKNKKRRLIRVANRNNLRIPVTAYRRSRGQKSKKLLGNFRFPNLVIFLSSSLYFQCAIRESVSVGIPSVGIVDSDSTFGLLSFPISGNDDSLLSIVLYLQIFSESIFRGISRNMFHEEVFLMLEDRLRGEKGRLISLSFTDKNDKLRSVRAMSTLGKRRFFVVFFKQLRFCSYYIFKSKLDRSVSSFYRFEIFSRFRKNYSIFRRLLLSLLRKCVTVAKRFAYNLSNFFCTFLRTLRRQLFFNNNLFVDSFVKMFSGSNVFFGGRGLRKFFSLRRKFNVAVRLLVSRVGKKYGYSG